ncbi:MAG: hypothetical protein B7Z55_19010, partial [Planctomycetales bacterium 12-60-4]
LVINGQESRIQVGQRLGYFVTTTTQTSTLQEVQFLETGVVLRVTPTISDHNRILMSVKPEVSDGSISDQGLPQERTTEVETTVMLQDGYGMVIGGLIKEDDLENQTKVPFLGDIWLVGRAFQRRKVTRSRSEIIIVLVPRVVPYGTDYECREDNDVTRATTSLLEGPLNRVDRTDLEPQLPDAMLDPRRVKWGRIPDFFKNVKHRKETLPLPLNHYLPSDSEEFPRVPGYMSDTARSIGVNPGPAPADVFVEPLLMPPAEVAPPPPPSPEFAPPESTKRGYE